MARPIRFAPLGRAPSLNKRWKRGGNQQFTVVSTGLSAEADAALAVPRLKALSPGVGAESDSAFSLFSGTDDWATRSAGAIFAHRLDNSTILNWRLLDGTQDHITLDTTVKVAGAAGSARFAVLDSDGTGSGQISVPYGTTFGNGSTHWVSYRVRAPAQQALQPWPSAGPTGHKISIISRDANGADPQGSNQVNELVIQANHNANNISGYYQDGVDTALLIEIGFSSSVNGGDFRDQPSIDRGVNRLTGLNPDTGAAWTTHEQERARWGVTYGARSSPGVANYKVGLGDPFMGGFRQTPDEWITITQRVIVGTFGSFNSRWTIWAARDGQPYTLIADKQNIRLGAGPNFNALNLLPYTSDRVSGGREISARTNNITGVDLLVCGLSTPIGTGTLEYNASTGRLRWAGQGESFGTARGFSTTNGIDTINVISTGNSYVVAKRGTGSLPPSGVITDSVTIINGRPDTQVNYNDFILKASAINAPGGFAPSGISALESAAAAMASGTWADFTMGGLNTNIILNSGNDDTIFSWGPKAHWDHVRKKIVMRGGFHGTVNEDRIITWDDATNTWSKELGPQGFPGPIHGYYGHAIDPVGARQFAHAENAFTQQYFTRNNFTGSWTSRNTAGLGNNSATDAFEFHPNMYGGVGGLVHANNWGIDSAPVDDFTPWTIHLDVPAGNAMGDLGMCTWFDPDTNCVYAGGGDGGETNFYRVSSTGVVTARAALPFQTGARGGRAVRGTGTRKILAVSSAGSIRGFNDGTNSWGTQITTLQFSPFDQGWFSCAIPEYGVVVFVYLSSATTAACKLWKQP